MSLIITRLKHRAKLLIGHLLGFFLSKQFSRVHGLSSRLISVFSDEAERIGVVRNILVSPIPVKRAAPNFFLNGTIETKYRDHFLSGENITRRAGIFSAENVDVSIPTSMHQIGNHVLEEILPAPYVLMNPKYYYGLESMRFKRKKFMDEGVLLSMPRHHNFYHWMVEMLPRLISYDRAPHLQHVPLIVPKSSPRFVAESLRLAGYQSKTIFLEDGVYRFKKLHMLSMLIATTEVSPDAVEWLNKKFTSASSTLNATKKIYVSRRDAKIRFVSNESQLADVLSEFGFETLVMSHLSLADQINVFSAAECIIGPHGAAFANLAFSKSGSTFIEFFSNGYYSPSYNSISACRGLKYGFLIGTPIGNGGFSIDPSRLRTVLSQALHPPF